MSKSKLHILCQQRGWELPTYEVNKQGHDHNPLFYATVTVNASSFSTSSPSSSSKKAKSDAAELALNHFSLPAPSLSAVMKLYMINQSSGASALFRPHQEMKKLMLCWSFASAGCSSGSAGVNTRPSTGGTLQLNQQDAKPTHLSNEAVGSFQKR
ncbi:hypothetical protein OIU84_027540 [Salix udensis]|uniref:DRBM domain-containing protein n=1 Tax=Salix udensis TaxID=889485 RepID=A0AAD6PBN1_9ROSI|nr:hypothetical protein OIU84_027540 [Salix udensis]